MKTLGHGIGVAQTVVEARYRIGHGAPGRRIDVRAPEASWRKRPAK